MEISKGDLVMSLAGRDQGKLFFVIACDEVYVTIVDGKSRKLERPKRKKRKHVRFVSRTESRIAGKILAGEPVLNSELRRALAVIGQDSPNQGG